MKHANPNNSRLFPYLLLLTAVFLFLEASFFIQWIHYYLGDYEVVAHHLSIPIPAIPGIIYFILIQFGIHFSYVVIIWLLARLIGIALTLPWKQIEKTGFALWIAGLMLVFLANQHFFPNSKFAYLVSFMVPTKIGFIFLVMLSFVLLCAFVTAMIGLFRFSRMVFVTVTIIALAVFALLNFSGAKTLYANDPNKPNIILIGIDSLRPDFLGYFGGEQQTPHIDAFLNQAVVFANAMTPLARTFPAWVSLLTGEYPKHNGIRTNLPDQSILDLRNTLPATLQKQNYETIFATDESRFSNIDRRFGFDKVVVPPIGFNDFLLGTMNDFPLSNLLINTSLGKYLFPYSYANRGVFTAYDPDTFLNALKTTLDQSQHRPLFLAVHFCLPHFPYFWGNDAAHDKSLNNYQAALRRVDQQFNDFLVLLTDQHLLEHSVIVLLSDHGEALELAGDRVTEEKSYIPGFNNKSKAIPHFYPPSVDTEAVNQSAGHGTDVLGLPQYRILLAFQTSAKVKGKKILDLVSLLDIKPTILSLLKIKDAKTDGRSLASLITGKSGGISHQKDFFIESDFSPKAIRSVHPEVQKVLFEGIDYFRIDPVTTRIVVKEDMMNLILSSKQYADFYGDWILALYPQNKQQMLPILVNRKTGQWTDNLQTPFAIDSPAKHMLSALKSFYGENMTIVLNS